MVLTVTLNPLLERRLYFAEVEPGKNNRANKEFFTAGGKGINVSRQLNFLGVINSSLTFIGGSNGKIFRRLLNEEKIDFSLVATKSETRSASLIIEENKQSITTFFGVNGAITADEAAEFKVKLDKMIQNCSTVVFSGSSPCEATDDIFPYGIELANEYDKVSILDTYGSHLGKCIDASPTVIHNNIDEVEKSIGISLKDEKDKINYMKEMYTKKIKLIFLTDSSNYAYAAKFDFDYKITPPKVKTIDSTGSGDSFVAGIVYGLENSLVFDEFLKIATALGAANAAKWETSGVSKNELYRYLDQVKIETIGKKMKIIDDSPNY